MASLTRDLRHVLAVAFRRPDADSELLGRFVAARDEAAFAEIVHRHGPAVLRVCRSLLNSADADDAFQTTFFVLARRAESLTDVRSLGGWLVGVAGRVARQLRRNGWRRAVVENEYRPHDSADAKHDQNLKELNEELTQLPNRYRNPIVLCFLQDRTQDEAAAELGQSVRTLRRRLEKAKALLRRRLVRRGVAPAVLVPITPLMITSAAAARTAAVAVQFLAGGVRSPAATLAKGVGMIALKWKVAAALTTAAGVFTALGFGVTQDAPKSAPRPNPPKAAADPVYPMPLVDGGTVTAENLTPTNSTPANYKFTEKSARGVEVSATNPMVSRVVRNEVEFQIDTLSHRWFGKSPELLPYKLFVTVDSAPVPGGSSMKQFGDHDSLKEARMALSGPLEPMLCDQLPCEVAHVVLAEQFGTKLPRWADDGLALTTTSPEHQARADAAIRQLLNAGKAYRLKALFTMKEIPEAKSERAVFVTESTSVMRYLLIRKIRDDVTVDETEGGKTRRIPNTASAMIAHFIRAGANKNDWDRAVNSYFGFKNVDDLEATWIKWQMSDQSRVGLPDVAPALPPPIAAEPARIPPVNLGK
jgi:RNA polymerase sigma factor (sigma-70 family)